MIKKFLVIILIFCTTLSYSQKKEFHVKTKDGKEYLVNQYIPRREYIIIKNGDQSIQIGYGNIDKIDVRYLKEKFKDLNHTAVFINYSEKFGALMKILVKGKCNLYSNTELAYAGTSTGFFVLRENESIATQLCDKNYVTLLNFKNRASEYFEDCDLLVEKIQKKKYKRKQVIEAVKFYNENCK